MNLKRLKTGHPARKKRTRRLVQALTHSLLENKVSFTRPGVTYKAVKTFNNFTIRLPNEQYCEPLDDGGRTNQDSMVVKTFNNSTIRLPNEQCCEPLDYGGRTNQDSMVKRVETKVSFKKPGMSYKIVQTFNNSTNRFPMEQCCKPFNYGGRTKQDYMVKIITHYANFNKLVSMDCGGGLYKTPNYNDKVTLEWLTVEVGDIVGLVTSDFRPHVIRLALAAFLKAYWTDCSSNLVYNCVRWGIKKPSTPHLEHSLIQPLRSTTSAQIKVKFDTSHLNIKNQAVTTIQSAEGMKLPGWFSKLLPLWIAVVLMLAQDVIGIASEPQLSIKEAVLRTILVASYLQHFVL
jgi:hypothetical protein